MSLGQTSVGLAGAYPAHVDAGLPGKGSGGGWRRSLIVFLAIQMVCLGSIALFNYIVNPLGTFSTHRFAPMVWNGRGEKVAALAAEFPKPEVLVLGSSRAWAIAPLKLTELLGLTSFNCGVSVAMAEDDYALLRYAVEQAGAKPKLVIIALDLEALHNGRPVDNRSQNVPELRAYLPSGGMAANVSRLRSLVAAQTIGLSARSVRLARRGKNDTPLDPLYTVGAHGDTHLSAMEHRLAHGETTRSIELQAAIPILQKRYTGYTALSAERLEYLRLALRYCEQRHIKVVVYLTPMSTRMQAALETKGFAARRQEALAQVSQITRDNGARFLDYTDVSAFGGSEDGFMDGAHMDQAAGAILVTQLLKETKMLP